MSRFTVHSTPLEGLKIVERQRLGDTRGSLSRLFCAGELAAAGWTKPIAQINHTVTAHPATIRGMHFQHPPHAEMKLVTCLSGAVFDVAVDLRAGSPTFLQWHGEILSAENNRALLIPEGFAHGFQTISADVEMLYCHSAPYAPDAEGGLQPLDPKLAIAWPLPSPTLSERDRNHPMIAPDFRGVTL
ncbi:MAG: dTDP-4-dehydrorhamnose 3,5-epimerase family protein [Proteobacteria bacterium]|nr:dTDP-4-dehydrorhamnose 3,5-epimerase family protein [Pseudomonadota bacterium]